MGRATASRRRVGAWRRAVAAARAGAVLAAAGWPSGGLAQAARAPVGAATPTSARDALAAWADSPAASRAVPTPADRPSAVARDARRTDPPTAGGRMPAPWWAVAASAAVPGSGQGALRQSRGVVYGAVEVYTWLRYRESHGLANRRSRETRRLARDVARRAGGGALPDGDWDYYERLNKVCANFPFAVACPSSGRYDAVPGGDLDPETDITTYNGQVWALARRTYWTDPDRPPVATSPEYQRALAEYRLRAEKPEFLWSWRDQQQSLDVYRQTITEANAAARDATRDLGVILANHVLSTVDAFVTVRVRRYGPEAGHGRGRTGLEASIPWGPFGRPRTAR